MNAWWWITEFSSNLLLCMRIRPVRLIHFRQSFLCFNCFWTILILWKADLNTRQLLCESRYVLWFLSIWFCIVTFNLWLTIKSIIKTRIFIWLRPGFRIDDAFLTAKVSFDCWSTLFSEMQLFAVAFAAYWCKWVIWTTFRQGIPVFWLRNCWM